MSIKGAIVTTSLIAGLAAIGYGLYKFYQYQVSLALQYCYKISNYKFNSIDKDGINLDVFLKIENKSDFIMTILGYNFNIFINGKNVGHVISQNQYTLANKSITELPINVTFNPLNSMNLGDALVLVNYGLNDQSKFIVEVIGNINGKMNFLKISDYPISIRMSLADILAPEDPNAPKTICDIK